MLTGINSAIKKWCGCNYMDKGKFSRSKGRSADFCFLNESFSGISLISVTEKKKKKRIVGKHPKAGGKNP